MTASLRERFHPYAEYLSLGGDLVYIHYIGSAHRNHEDSFKVLVDNEAAETILSALEGGTLQSAIDTLFSTDQSGALLRKTVELLDQGDKEALVIRKILRVIQDYEGAK